MTSSCCPRSTRKWARCSFPSSVHRRHSRFFRRPAPSSPIIGPRIFIGGSICFRPGRRPRHANWWKRASATHRKQSFCATSSSSLGATLRTCRRGPPPKNRPTRKDSARRCGSGPGGNSIIDRSVINAPIALGALGRSPCVPWFRNSLNNAAPRIGAPTEIRK